MNRPFPDWHRRHNEVVEYQVELQRRLAHLFHQEVRREWLISDADPLWRRPLHPIRRRPMYEPCVDLAVGPFAVQGRLIQDYDRLFEIYREVFVNLHTRHVDNVANYASEFEPADIEFIGGVNENARCLVAFEIERGNATAKYLMGSAFNAVALGRIGIVIAWDVPRLRDLLAIREYLMFLTAVGKNTFSAANLLVISKEQMDAVVRDAA